MSRRNTSGDYVGNDYYWNGLPQTDNRFPTGLSQRFYVTDYFNDFRVKASDFGSDDWTVTPITAGTAGIQDSGTGCICIGNLLLTAPADAQGPIVQFDGTAAFKKSPLAVVPFYEEVGSYTASSFSWGARFRLTDPVDEAGMFVGMAELNTQSGVIATADGGVTSDNYVGFSFTDSDSGQVRFDARGSGGAKTQVDSVHTLDIQYVDVAVHVEGADKVFGYIKTAGQNKPWQQVAEATLATPLGIGTSPGFDPDTTQLLLTFALIGSGGERKMVIDYVWTSHKRLWEWPN